MHELGKDWRELQNQLSGTGKGDKTEILYVARGPFLIKVSDKAEKIKKLNFWKAEVTKMNQVSLSLPEMKTRVHYISTFTGRNYWAVTQVLVVAVKTYLDQGWKK